jgi:hypothetical protein
MAEIANTTNLSRRAILTGLPVAAIGIGADLPALAAESTDSVLLDLDVKFAHCFRECIVPRLKELEEAYDPVADGAGADGALERLMDVVAQIVNVPATSLKGFAVKANLILSEALDMRQIGDLWSMAEIDLDWEIVIPLKFVNELRAFAGLGATPMRNV